MHWLAGYIKIEFFDLCHIKPYHAITYFLGTKKVQMPILAISLLTSSEVARFILGGVSAFPVISNGVVGLISMQYIADSNK